MLSVFYRVESHKAELVENARNIFVKENIKETWVHTVDSKRVHKIKDKGVQRSNVLATTSRNIGNEDNCIIVEKAPAGKEKCVTTNYEKAEESQYSMNVDSDAEEVDKEYSEGLAQQSSVRKQSILVSTCSFFFANRV